MPKPPASPPSTAPVLPVTPVTPAARKTELIRELVEILGRELETLEQNHRETRAAATHEEAKPENDKDTRALEQSYLARGQALRVQEVRESIARVRSTGVDAAARDVATLGSLVLVFDEHDEIERTFLLMPAGGGSRLAEASGVAVLVVTPESPWGRALVGARRGDSREVTIAGTLRDFEVKAIS